MTRKPCVARHVLQAKVTVTCVSPPSTGLRTTQVPIFGMPWTFGLATGFILEAVGPALVIQLMFENASKGLGTGKGAATMKRGLVDHLRCPVAFDVNLRHEPVGAQIHSLQQRIPF